jgi:hypothetical protein
LVLVAGIPAFAYAQSDTKPVFDSWPRKVRTNGDAVLKAHVQNGTAGQEVSLERKRAGGEWYPINSKPTRDDSSVTFHVNDLHLTANYRLITTDAAGAEARSEEIRIGVVPRLTFVAGKDDVMIHREVHLFGTLSGKSADREILLEQKIAGEWRSIARVPVRDGRFEKTFTPDHRGFRLIRAGFAGDAFNSRAFSATGIRIYEPDPATWYGPGLYGNRTACGKRLERGTLGVAHRSLPCGTEIAILFQGRTITVPVIDRGPYSSADWDLTEETADRLGFEGSDTIGVDPKS